MFLVTTKATSSSPSTSARSAGSPTLAADIAYVAVFAALIAVLGFVAIPMGSLGVPLVLQNAATILAGLVLGPKRGFLAAGLFLLVSTFLPVLAGGHTLIQAFAGPTIGYLLGYLLGAGAAGWFAYVALRRSRDNKVIVVGIFIAGAVVAQILQWVFGAFGLMWRADLGLGKAFAAQIAFVGPGLLKAGIMIAVALAVHAAFPQLHRTRTVTNDVRN